jgi:ribosome-associated protein
MSNLPQTGGGFCSYTWPMLQATPSIIINDRELIFDFIHSSGPGGQNVNKVATAVQLRFNVEKTSSLPEDVKARLITLAGSRMTDQGEIVIEAKRYRSQAKNREDATQRLIALIIQAAAKPKNRRRTRPSVSAKAARVFDKKQRGALKRIRKYNPEDWE